MVLQQKNKQTKKSAQSRTNISENYFCNQVAIQDGNSPPLRLFCKQNLISINIYGKFKTLFKGWLLPTLSVEEN